MTTKINKSARNPDYHAAAAAEAMALRCLSRYRAARDSVEGYGGDLSHLVEPPAFHDIDARYAEQVRIVTQEPPDTVSSELAYLELVEIIIADEISGHSGRVMGHDEDLCCAQQIVQWIIRKANDRDISEGIGRERAGRGAGAAPPCRLVRPEKEGAIDEMPGSGGAA